MTVISAPPGFACIDQVVEEQELNSSFRRAGVIDTATGKPWIPPDSGWLRVKFKASRELPSMKVTVV